MGNSIFGFFRNSGFGFYVFRFYNFFAGSARKKFATCKRIVVQVFGDERAYGQIFDFFGVKTVFFQKGKGSRVERS
jgi:hypothetical protein